MQQIQGRYRGVTSFFCWFSMFPQLSSWGLWKQPGEDGRNGTLDLGLGWIIKWYNWYPNFGPHEYLNISFCFLWDFKGCCRVKSLSDKLHKLMWHFFCVDSQVAPGISCWKNSQKTIASLVHQDYGTPEPEWRCNLLELAAKATENGCLEDENFPFGAYGLFSVSFREGISNYRNGVFFPTVLPERIWWLNGALRGFNGLKLHIKNEDSWKNPMRLVNFLVREIHCHTCRFPIISQIFAPIFQASKWESGKAWLIRGEALPIQSGVLGRPRSKTRRFVGLGAFPGDSWPFVAPKSSPDSIFAPHEVLILKDGSQHFLFPFLGDVFILWTFFFSGWYSECYSNWQFVFRRF